jgi:alpha-glucosidase
MRVKKLSFFIFLSVLTYCSNAQNVYSIASPDNLLEISLSERNGRLLWSLAFRDEIIIAPSALGFFIQDSTDLSQKLQITGSDTSSFSEVWQTVWGPNKYISNNYNELKCHIFQSETQIVFDIVFRVYNDGLGFRYEFPEQPFLKEFVILDEKTQFVLAGFPESVWWIMADFDSYEKLYHKTSFSEAQWVNTPVTLRTPSGKYMSIHEAALLDYSEMTLRQLPDSELTWEVALAPWSDGTKVKTSTPMKTPWRTIQVTETAGGLIESNLIVNLNEPCKIEDVSWISPMKYIGIWWGMHIGTETWTEGPRHGATTEKAKQYIDFAAENNIQGVVVEGWNKGWDRWGERGAFDQMTPASDYDLHEVAAYAQEKEIYLIMHHETGGDAEGYEIIMEQAFQLCRNLGIQALKTGYAGGIYPRGEYHHGQYMVRHYQKVVETAADYQIMLNVHEPIKPTGLYRTWPNMMTREGVRGMEWNAWSEGNTPSHTVTLPFTRMLAGPLDYTPAIFDVLIDNNIDPRTAWNFNIDDISLTRVHTTLMHQVALFFILYSPMQMAADLPQNYQGHPVFEVIRSAPVLWEESHVINGEIGEYITIARRSGKEWWIASATNETGRTIRISTSFLAPDIIYSVTIFSDAADTHYLSDPETFQISSYRIQNTDTLSLNLAPGGGAVIHILEQ